MLLGSPNTAQGNVRQTLSGDIEAYGSGDDSKWDSSNILSWERIRALFSEAVVFPKSIEIHVIRHAQSEINARKLITGSQDAKLTSIGREQAKLLGRKLDSAYDIAFTSALQRAKDTLKIALSNGSVSTAEFIQDERLNERSLGILEGKQQQNVLEYALGDLDYAPENGESYREVSQRVLSFLYNVASYAAEKDIRKILICSHMGPMRIMAGIFANMDDPVEVLGFHFSNTKVLKTKWRGLSLPKFLS